MNEQPATIGSHAVTSSWLPLVVQLGDFLKANIPIRQPIVEGFLYTQSMAMIFARRGTGKTRFMASMSVSIAKGRPFLGWKIPKARRVLFVDGELSAPDLQSIFRDFTGVEPTDNIEIISSETFSARFGRGLNIATQEDQKQFLELLNSLKAENREPEVIIFDNHSSLTGGLDENDNSKQEIVLSFFRKLRHLGYTVILIHHAGKSGDQRGATRREDFLDLSVKLQDRQSIDGSAKFDIKITKSRWKMAKHEFSCLLVPDEKNPGQFIWAVKDGSNQQNTEDRENSLLEWIYFNKPDDQAEIMAATGIPKSTVSRYVAKLIGKGYLETGFKVTDKGKDFLGIEE